MLYEVITPNVVEAEIAIRDFLTTNTKKISSKHILQTVCEYYEISEDEITSNKKNQSVAYPRQMAMYLTRKLMDLSYKAIRITSYNVCYTKLLRVAQVPIVTFGL